MTQEAKRAAVSGERCQGIGCQAEAVYRLGYVDAQGGGRRTSVGPVRTCRDCLPPILDVWLEATYSGAWTVAVRRA